MTALDALDAFEARAGDELAALAAGDLDRLADATRAKLAAVEALRNIERGALPPGRVTRAALLNREAARRVNAARAAVERRLAGLARATGRGGAGLYDARGRAATGLAG